jgi:hypothetical protein
MRALPWGGRLAPGPVSLPLDRPAVGTAASHPWCRRTGLGEQAPGQETGSSTGAGQQLLPSMVPDLLSFYGRRLPRPRSQRLVRRFPARPWPGEEGHYQPQPTSPEPEWDSGPPLAIMPSWHPTAKISPMAFLSPGKLSVENTPPAFFPPKNFISKIWLVGGASLRRLMHFMPPPSPDSPFHGRGGALVSLKWRQYATLPPSGSRSKAWPCWTEIFSITWLSPSGRGTDEGRRGLPARTD